MKISDALIIYFSAGAPVAVYFYFRNRASSATAARLLGGIFLAWLFWIPAAARFLAERLGARRNRIFRRVKNEESRQPEQQQRARNLYRLQKRLEMFLRASDCDATIFEFRETAERYIGLTVAAQIDASETGAEFFRAAQNKNPELAAKCFGRRNRQRLFFHQTSARHDFLQILARISRGASDTGEIKRIACEFAEILEDSAARKAVERLFPRHALNAENTSNGITEKDLWNSHAQRPPPPNAFNIISTLIQTSDLPQTATTRSSSKE